MIRRSFVAGLFVTSGIIGISGIVAITGSGLVAPTVPSPEVIIPAAPSSFGVLDAIETSAGIDSATVTRIVTKQMADPNLGSGVSAYVIDANSQTVLVDINSDEQMIPASTLKIYTGIAAMNLLGSETRFVTKVMRDDNVLTLVGGGDPTLVSLTPKNWRGKPAGSEQPPSIEQLADKTAAAIGVTTDVFAVAFDDSLFSPPKAQETWPDVYVRTGEVAPAQGLTVDFGVSQTDVTLKDPAKSAAKYFVDALSARGLQVSLADRALASANATELTRIQSATVTDIVERMITTSNNTMAEFLAHHLGGTQGNYSYEGGAAVTKQALLDAGLDTSKLKILDGSGLSRSNRTTARDLVAAFEYANDSNGPAWANLSGLPVAGISGTLIDRYGVNEPGRGTVRAKTGTLSKVVSLSGTLVTESGDLLIFAFIANEVPNGTMRGRSALDGVIKTLVRCGCRVA